MSDPWALGSRAGLPEALRALVDAHPRAGWEGSPRFEGLVRFWLERHLMFRRVLAALETDALAMAEGGIDAPDFALRLGRLGSGLVNGLHGHHQIEDAHYFPLLRRAEPGLGRGFDILDADHHALDAGLASFAARANAALAAVRDGAEERSAAGRFGEELAQFGRFLDRHLTDEEDLVVPVILKHGPEALG